MTAELHLVKRCEEHGSVERHPICNCLPGEGQHGEWCYCPGGSVEVLDQDLPVVLHGGQAEVETVWDHKAKTEIEMLHFTIQQITDALGER